jgi:hypothetical protein
MVDFSVTFDQSNVADACSIVADDLVRPSAGTSDPELPERDSEKYEEEIVISDMCRPAVLGVNGSVWPARALWPKLLFGMTAHSRKTENMIQIVINNVCAYADIELERYKTHFSVHLF